MDVSRSSPRFGTADLSNCERELIHLPGSIQPHGALLVVREADRVVTRVSENARDHFGVEPERLVDRSLEEVDAALAEAVAEAPVGLVRDMRYPISFRRSTGGTERPYLGLVHRHPVDGLFVELEPLDTLPAVEDYPAFLRRADRAVEAVGSAPDVSELGRTLARSIRRLTGYDRVMIYRFDRDGHGEVIAEERHRRLDSFLGLNYPATDIPQRARTLYQRNRLRVLVDVDYEAVPVTPRFSPTSGEALDMSMCYLRSVSPIHLQFLRNMGVTGTLVTSLVVNGTLWGLVACHHYSPKNLAYEVRAVCELLSEVASSRLALLESQMRAEAELQVRRLEDDLIAAASRDGDWRPALLQDPRVLLEPLDATGAALFYDDQIHTVGEVPSTSDLRGLWHCVAQATEGHLYRTRSIAGQHPELAELAPTVAGVLAVELSSPGREFLMWFRPEQIEKVRWGGDPRKPMIIGDDPSDLSPRRSFAVWTEMVRGTSKAWEEREVALARILGESLRDLIAQVRSMRLLLTEQENVKLRRSLHGSSEPLIVASADGRILFQNEAFSRIFRRPHVHIESLEDLPTLFFEPTRVRELMRMLLEDHLPWHGELRLLAQDDQQVPVAVRMDPIPSRGGSPIGYVLIVTDLTDWKRNEAARRELFHTVRGSFQGGGPADEADMSSRFHSSLESVLRGVATGVGSSGTRRKESIEDLGEVARRAAVLSRELERFTRGLDRPER